MDFDKIIPRRGTGCVKWDRRPDVLPMWVADMDFQVAPCIIEALHRRVDHGVFGYTLIRDDYYDALIDWFASRHLYNINRDHLLHTPGVVPALSAIVKALVPPGKGVIIQPPVYNCFFSSVRNNDARLVENPLQRVELPGGEFTYRMDYEGLERAAADPDNVLMILCNPHNPAGRAWTREELEKVCDICRRHGVRVVSDEIHCELTMPGHRYVPYGNIDPEAIVCNSPSKSFNFAGLQISNVIVPSAEERALIDRAINVNEICDVNPFGVEALIAAYSPQGRQWLEELMEYIKGNYDYVRAFFAEHLPQCPVVRLEATYLPWIDITALGLGARELEEKLINEAGVWVNAGEMYGAEGYIRLNIACPRATLEEGLNRIAACLTR